MNYYPLKQTGRNTAARPSFLSAKNLSELCTYMIHTRNSKNFKNLQVTATNLLLVQLQALVRKIGENKSAVYFTTSCCLIVKERDFFLKPDYYYVLLFLGRIMLHSPLRIIMIAETNWNLPGACFLQSYVRYTCPKIHSWNHW